MNKRTKRVIKSKISKFKMDLIDTTKRWTLLIIFGFFLVYGLMASVTNLLGIKYPPTIDASSIEPTVVEKTIEVEKVVEVEKPVEVIKYIVLETKLPEELTKRREAILNYFRAKGYSESDIQKWNTIISRETGDRLDPNIEPPVFVKHCQGANGWYSVEVSSSGGQAYCNSGDLEGRNEKSKGLFQILQSTWERYECKGDRSNWVDQINCAEKLQKRDGFTTHWHYVK